jgi:hypothetical protein
MRTQRRVTETYGKGGQCLLHCHPFTVVDQPGSRRAAKVMHKRPEITITVSGAATGGQVDALDD